MFSRLTRPKVFATGANEAKGSADRNFPSIGTSETQVTADRSFFCAWSDRKFLGLARPTHKCSPTENFFVTGANEAYVTSDVFFSDWRERCKNERWLKYFWVWRDRKFLRLAWPKLKCPPNEAKLSADRNYFATELTEVRMTADRNVFASDKTEIVCDWRDQSKSVWLPKFFRTRASEVQVTADRSFFATEVTAARLTDHRRVFAPGATVHFCDWRDRSISFRRPKFICDWRDRSKMTADWSEVSADRNFWRLRWPQHNLPPTEEFSSPARQNISRLAQKTLFAFSDWHDWSKNHCRPKFFQTKASDVLVTNDQFFCVWRDWKFLRLARPKYKCLPTEVLFWLVQKEHKWPLMKSF